jgi:SAM-dependent methyltransferase
MSVPEASAGGYTPALADLMEHEKVIEQGLAGFVEVGMALAAIKDGKKYRAAGYDTFEAYAQQRWGMERRRADQMIDASRVTAVIMETRTGTIVPVLPTNEAQARPLAKLRDKPETMQEAWTDAVELADGGQPTAVQVAAAVGAIEAREAPPKPAIRKPDLDGQGLAHPARYSKELYPLFADLLAVHILKLGATVLDPFAGTGGIHRLQDHGYKTAGIEIETEWAALHPGTVVGSALDLPFGDDTFDAIVTSPTYGNRLADSHNAADPELRRSYTHDLGHELNADNSGAMHWGDRYRRFHEEAWIEAVRVLAPSGVFLLNVKDHIRRGARQHVAGWHVTTLCRLGLTLLEHHDVVTAQLRQGENASLRFTEQVYVFTKDLDDLLA